MNAIYFYVKMQGLPTTRVKSRKCNSSTNSVTRIISVVTRIAIIRTLVAILIVIPDTTMTIEVSRSGLKIQDLEFQKARNPNYLLSFKKVWIVLVRER